MWISRNYLAVKGGYSSGIEVLYATPDYYRYEINSYEEAIEEYKHQERDEFYTEEYIAQRIEDCKNEIKTLEEKLKEV